VVEGLGGLEARELGNHHALWGPVPFHHFHCTAANADFSVVGLKGRRGPFLVFLVLGITFVQGEEVLLGKAQ
jgi:hypothetical protein